MYANFTKIYPTYSFSFQLCLNHVCQLGYKMPEILHSQDKWYQTLNNFYNDLSFLSFTGVPHWRNKSPIWTLQSAPESYFQLGYKDENTACILIIFRVKMWILPGWILRGSNMCNKTWILWNFWMLAKHHTNVRIYKKGWPGTVKTKGNSAQFKDARSIFYFRIWKFLLKILEYVKLRIVVGEISIRKRWIDLPKVS